jgi:polyisoprenoid-binding protein YceI
MKKTIILFTLVLFVYNLSAQVKYTINKESVMTISGTSTIHEWTSKVNTINGEIIFLKSSRDKSMPQKGKLAQSVKIEVPVKSIESPRGPVMDGKTYDALKSEEFPNILFQLSDNNITEVTDKASNKFKLLITGNLTIAGNMNPVTLTLDGQRLEGNSFRLIGNYMLKMSDFKVDPPTAMFGQIVTGDLVTIAFNLLIDAEKK